MTAIIFALVAVALALSLALWARRALIRERRKRAAASLFAEQMQRMSRQIQESGEEMGRALIPAMRSLSAAVTAALGTEQEGHTE